MPAKKRKAPPAAPAIRGKRVRTTSSSAIREDGTSMVSASGRPKRSTAGDPNYDQTRRHSSTTATPKLKKAATPTSQPTKCGPGRPPKATTKTTSASGETITVEQPSGQRLSVATHVEIPVRKRGQPRKEATRYGDSAGSAVQQEEQNDNGSEHSDTYDDRQFWLMKAEPDSRIEKGTDVKFSIDDLMSKTEPEPWDGVRNAVARNYMRAMKVGDLAFLYHSNCTIPGIAGIMQIVREHSIDESAFDPTHPYYDPKSTDRSNPKWELVHVKGLHKFANLITLAQLKAYRGLGEPLQYLQTLMQSRLSVSAVTPSEWNFIMDLSGEEFPNDEALEHVEEGTAPDDEADTTKADAHSGAKVAAEDGPGAFDLDTDI